jgi:hypothetical protein
MLFGEGLTAALAASITGSPPVRDPSRAEGDSSLGEVWLPIVQHSRTAAQPH